MTEEKAEIHGRIKRVRSLPTLPGVVQRLLAMVETDESSAAQVGEIISSDQVLTAKILKIVNSPFYGFPGRIATINHALVLLGFDVVKGIVLSAAVIDYMTDSLVGLWEHSIGVATATGIIARAVEAPEPEEISTAGLLHDLGKVILSVEMKDECERVMNEAEWNGLSFLESEERVLGGVNHCQIAGWLAEEWHLPPRLRDPITRHHEPWKAQDAPVPTAVVHLANVLTRGLQFGSGGDPFVSKLHAGALDTLNLRMADLARLIEEIDDAFDKIDTSDFTG